MRLGAAREPMVEASSRSKPATWQWCQVPDGQSCPVPSPP